MYDDKQILVILFELRQLVVRRRIFDRERVEAELFLQDARFRDGRIDKIKPDERRGLEHVADRAEIGQMLRLRVLAEDEAPWGRRVDGGGR